MGGFTVGAGGGGLLERSAELNALGQALAAATSSGQGRIALVAGEAGIGKTTLLGQFTAGAGASARVLWARCEPLFTPRPLGPVLELAEATGSTAAIRAAGGGMPYDVAMALFPDLAAEPSVVVFEDVHWADEATLDVVRLLARRLANAPILLVLSYREHELDRSHPLRVILGDLPGSGQVTRLELSGLSPLGVAELAGPGPVDAGELHRRTGGNPFFVTEVLAAGTAAIPGSVRDAVLARAASVHGAARDLLDMASVVPGTVEAWLLDALVPTAAEALDECLATGVLRSAGDRVEFRHEIARQVVEESLPPGRRKAIHRAALSALASRPAGQRDLARLAHHADAAEDVAAMLEYAPAAAARAQAAGAYREAARLFARALTYADTLAPERQAELLEGFAGVAYFTELGAEATEALRKAAAIHGERGDVVRQGGALRRLADQLGKNGALAEAEAAITEAVTLLESQPPSRELAIAYNAMAAVTGIADDDGAVLWGKRAIEVAELVGCLDAIGDTLSILGTAELRQGNLAGLDKLDQSREIAWQVGDERGIAQALSRAAAALAGRREWALAEPYISQGRDFCQQRGLQSLYGWLTNFAAEDALARGRWDEAVATSAEILSWPTMGFRALRVTALVVTATVQARRGESGYEPLLAEATAYAEAMPAGRHGLQLAALRAELAWLAGSPPVVLAQEADPGEAVPSAVRWFAGEPEAWQHRAGRYDGDPAGLPDPYQLEITGDVKGAARWWQQRGCTYDAALALACSGDRLLMRKALDMLLDLGAQPAAAVVTRQLRELGEQGLRRGRRPATAANAAGLTSRETEILTLVAAGLNNAEIAAQLVVSGRTVDNHVAAIFRKLDVRNRDAARSAAMRLGLVTGS